ncbi:unnamed protein product, partial [Prorocentrum cordatum]
MTVPDGRHGESSQERGRSRSQEDTRAREPVSPPYSPEKRVHRQPAERGSPEQPAGDGDKSPETKSPRSPLRSLARRVRRMRANSAGGSPRSAADASGKAKVRPAGPPPSFVSSRMPLFPIPEFYDEDEDDPRLSDLLGTPASRPAPGASVLLGGLVPGVELGKADKPSPLAGYSAAPKSPALVDASHVGACGAPMEEGGGHPLPPSSAAAVQDFWTTRRCVSPSRRALLDSCEPMCEDASAFAGGPEAAGLEEPPSPPALGAFCSIMELRRACSPSRRRRGSWGDAAPRHQDPLQLVSAQPGPAEARAKERPGGSPRKARPNLLAVHRRGSRDEGAEGDTPLSELVATPPLSDRSQAPSLLSTHSPPGEGPSRPRVYRRGSRDEDADDDARLGEDLVPPLHRRGPREEEPAPSRPERRQAPSLLSTHGLPSEGPRAPVLRRRSREEDASARFGEDVAPPRPERKKPAPLLSPSGAAFEAPAAPGARRHSADPPASRARHGAPAAPREDPAAAPAAQEGASRKTRSEIAAAAAPAPRDRQRVRGNRSDPGIFSTSAPRDGGSHILDGGLEHAILGNALIIYEEESTKCESRSPGKK